MASKGLARQFYHFYQRIEKRLIKFWRLTAATTPFARLKLLFFLVLAVLFLPVFFIYGQRQIIPQQEKIAAYARSEMKQIAANLQVKMDDYENISIQLIANQDLNNMLQEYVTATETYGVSQYNQSFSNFMDGYAFFDPVLAEAVFFDHNNPKRKALTMGELVSTQFLWNFRESLQYQRIMAAGGQIVRFGPLRLHLNQDYFLVLGRRINHLYSGEPLGLLLLFLKEKYLDYSINDHLYKEEHSLDGKLKSDYYLLVDGEGTILSSPFKEEIATKVASLFSDLSSFRLHDLLKTEVSLFTQAHGSTVLVVNYPLAENNWLLLNVIPIAQGLVRKAHFFSVFRTIYWLLFVTLELFFFCSALAVYKGVFPAFTAVSPAVPTPVAPGKPAWLEKLNEREIQILTLIAQGCDNRQIAERLHLAEQTVKNNISALYTKLQVENRVQASLKAIEAGLTTGPPPQT